MTATRGVTRMIRCVLALALLAPADTAPVAEPPAPPLTRVEPDVDVQVTARDQRDARLKAQAARYFNPHRRQKARASSDERPEP
jgi:hypothetical protein